MENDFWDKMLFNNTVEEYGIALAILVGLIILFYIFQRIALHRLEKLAKLTKTNIDDAVINIFRSIKPPFYFFIAFFIAIQFLDFPDMANKIVSAFLIVWVVFLAVKASQIFINTLFKEKMESESDRGTKSALGAINIIIKIIIWSIGLLMILSNLGIDITSLIAGLGIGGIAIAFALQNILSDLFSSFSIYFDKPFVVGDFIIVGGKSGTVKKIGIKSTRIRALQGEEVVISNNELTSSQIQNFKKMERRRVVFSIGVLYETSTEKMKMVPEIIKKIFESVDGIDLDRVHFNEFGDFSLGFEIAYFVQSPDFVKNMDVRHEINLKIKDEFEKVGIEMAFPTQTLYIKK
ncbi:MAG: mechanosensitive ion channel family protein [Candidatus Kerfeldbacteria bacterium]